MPAGVLPQVRVNGCLLCGGAWTVVSPWRFAQTYPVLMSFSTITREETAGISVVQKWEVLMDRIDRCACYYDDAVNEDALIGLAFIPEDE